MSELKTPQVTLTERVIDTPSPVTVDGGLHVLVLLNSASSYLTRTINSQVKLLKYYGADDKVSPSSPRDLLNAYRLIKTVPLTVVPISRSTPRCIIGRMEKIEEETRFNLSELTPFDKLDKSDIRITYYGSKSFTVASTPDDITIQLGSDSYKFDKSKLISKIYEEELSDLDIKVTVTDITTLDTSSKKASDATEDTSYDYNEEIKKQHEDYRVDLISDLGNNVSITVGEVLISRSVREPSSSVLNANGDQMIYHYNDIVDSDTASFSFSVAPSTIYAESVAKAYLAGHPFGGVYSHRLGVVYPGKPSVELDRTKRDLITSYGINVIYADTRPRYDHILICSNYTATSLNNPMRKESHRRLANRINYDTKMISESWIGRVINDKLYEEITSTLKSYIESTIMCYPESLETFDVICDRSNNSDIDRANNIVNISLNGKFSGEVDIVNILSTYYSLNPE